MNTTTNWRRNSGRPNPNPIPGLSGAALRSMEAADTIARAAWDALERVEDAIAAHWSTPAERVDAAWIAQAIRLTSELRRAAKAVDRGGTVAPRWQSPNAGDSPSHVGGGWPATAAEVFGGARTSTDRYALVELITSRLLTLRNAGIPMPDAGTGTAEYWDDASARGC